MSNRPVVSLCIPTNGVVEWVCPVLDSIFQQNVDANLYEVVVTDNGSNEQFREIMEREYLPRFSNLVYEKTTAPLFLNEIESYKRARGLLIKFVNHRTMLLPGALEKLIVFAQENAVEKPVVYFSNGVLSLDKGIQVYDTFDQFVKDLSYWSSWSTGMTIWKEDFDRIPEGTEFNELFPHTTILFAERNRSQYVIDNTLIMDEIPAGKKPKGQYDVFYAFAVEYMGILLDLVRSGDISQETFWDVKSANGDFLAELYFDFVLRKRYCSYDLSSFSSSVAVFYNKPQIFAKICKLILIRGKRKLGVGT